MPDGLIRIILLHI